MKEIIRLFGLLSGAILVLGVSSCDDSNDLIDQTAPTIEVENPVAEMQSPAGDYMVFESTFTDDMELATYSIEIHENFDRHGHGRIAKANNDPSLLKWSYKESFEIPAGLWLYQAVLEEEIAVPDNAMAGPYHFIVQAIDKAGNSTSFQDASTVELTIYISNESQPKVQITNLQEGELEIEVGVLFMVEGHISDPTAGTYAGMEDIDIVLGEDVEDEHGHDHGRIASEEPIIDFHLGGEEMGQYMVDGVVQLNPIFTDINFTLSLEQLADLQAEEVDHLVLTITVVDNQGNITISETPVHIHTE